MKAAELFEDVRVVDMSNEEYHALPWDSVSKTRLTTFADDPAEFYGRYVTGEIPSPDTDDLVFGRVFHEVVLEHQGIVDEGSYREETLAVFRSTDAPKRAPDYEDDDERVWVVVLPEPGIVRQSDVWGAMSGGRYWVLAHDTDEVSVTAFCAFADMHRDGVAFRNIPDSVLSAQGHKRGKQWTEWAASHDGEVLYKSSDWTRILSMRRRLRQHGDAHRCLFEGGVAEQTLIGRCAVTGLEVRTRIDFQKPEDGVLLVSDLKTSRDPRPRPWMKQAISGDLHVQAAMVSGMVAHTTDKDVSFVFVVIGKTGSYRPETFEIEPELMELGIDRYVSLMQRFQECAETGIWQLPDFGERHVLHTPEYLMPKWE